MKKILGIILIINIIGIFGAYTNGAEKIKDEKGITYGYEDVKDKLIRFHVLANSDTKEDQELKMKVKDKVINYMQPILNKSKSLEESRELLKKHSDKIQEIAKEVIKQEGYDYNVQIELSKENFPEKVYGNIILPQGEYEAFRILIGEHKGQNWWCVMFPPLCFTDVTRGEVAYEETEEKMDKALQGNVSYEQKDEVKLKFKLFEVVKEMF